ncbi:threonine-phosphate decarboxylase CobD [uncultured Jannaschia sp.]|uniref:threonine-phosphate decarboxylase CobD n=1 Tax=uncultured Jannaschia sp. TaxID=293347 RepID=UPI0026174B9F|nr:threonine-phosphate decarboxylase CobD [uncultured Jannaschia sp.]
MSAPRDHGGGLDAARARWGGARDDWIDLSTGINPMPYPVPALARDAWTALPDAAAATALNEAARRFWGVPEGAAILAAPGASALIARMPALVPGNRVRIPDPTYNEHAAAFRAHGFAVDATSAPLVVVHPNNPDGRLWPASDLPDDVTIIDESFCDVCPEASHVARAARPGTVVLKSFGKFWGLAGLRLGFAIGAPETIAPLAEPLGPWPVSGPALAIGAAALADTGWADATRTRLAADADRLDALMAPHGDPVGGTTLFRLYDTADAATLRDRLAEHRIWSRVFPYSDRWLRLGLPAPDGWDRLKAALA